MKELTVVLKIFIEKHLISTVIAAIGAILTVTLTNSEFYLLEKLGKSWYGILSFCIYFLFVQLIILISKGISRMNRNWQNFAYNQKETEKRNKEILEQMWTRVDGLTQSDYDYLIQFIKSNNAPILVKGTHFGDCLFTSNLVNLTTQKESVKNEFMPTNIKNEKEDVIPKTHAFYSIPDKQYKLKDDIYRMLKYSYDTYGKISHFAKEDMNNGQT